MTIYEDILHTRVQRYEAALSELLAAHQDVKGVLLDQILFERWQQVGADLGYLPGAAVPSSRTATSPRSTTRSRN